MDDFRLSLILTTKGEIERLRPLFEVTDNFTEIIISDLYYNNDTKEYLESQIGKYEDIIYTPILEDTYNYQKNYISGLNTALLSANNSWIIRADDNLEFKGDFFRLIRENIRSFKDVVRKERFVILGQELFKSLNHRKWIDYCSFSQPSRYINITDPLTSFSIAIYPLDLIYNLSGYDEHRGKESNDQNLFYHALVSGYNIFFDRHLMAYSYY